VQAVAALALASAHPDFAAVRKKVLRRSFVRAISQGRSRVAAEMTSGRFQKHPSKGLFVGTVSVDFWAWWPIQQRYPSIEIVANPERLRLHLAAGQAGGSLCFHEPLAAVRLRLSYLL